MCCRLCKRPCRVCRATAKVPRRLWRVARVRDVATRTFDIVSSGYPLPHGDVDPTKGETGSPNGTAGRGAVPLTFDLARTPPTFLVPLTARLPRASTVSGALAAGQPRLTGCDPAGREKGRLHARPWW